MNLQRRCILWYGITYDDVMRYKHEWLTAIRNSEDRYSK